MPISYGNKGNLMLLRLSYLVLFISIIFQSPVTNAVAQDWVHPMNRHKYEGYKKHEEQKKNSPIWTYATNRPRGNVKGGGTTSYWNYQPNYKPEFTLKNKKYQRPKKIGGENQDTCNCGD